MSWHVKRKLCIPSERSWMREGDKGGGGGGGTIIYSVITVLLLELDSIPVSVGLMDVLCNFFHLPACLVAVSVGGWVAVVPEMDG
ncbi:hypothetical protein B9Z19DRAFT_1077376 [Tuber borchii]|uniref:Uncharacterized protein n=1 Tax=Tuber borchii TaxID=42251 RepID=A0A2T7A129_TUBBO|nr:hypothetical protein B9Z19DRAFT_1077376 [Tuber borchii]